MAANLIVFLFSGLMAGLVYYFRLRGASSKAEVGRLAMVLAFIGVFFLVNALFAEMGRRALLTVVDAPPVLSIDELGMVETGSPVILDGIVSLENPTHIKNYVSYVECNDDACIRYVPSSLLIRLDGGDVAISNDDFEERKWSYAPDGVLFLAPGDPVIVVGSMERGVTMLGPDKGKETSSIYAEIVYAGSHEDFVARAEARVIFPTLLLVGNLAAGVGVLLLPWASWYLRPKRTAER